MCLLPCSPRGAADEPFGLPLSGEPAETFLQRGARHDKKSLRVGITRSHRYTLTDGTRKARAIWKTIDESKPGRHQLPGRRLRRRLLGLLEARGGLLRARQAGGHRARAADGGAHASTAFTGSLQLWVEKAKTEADRKRSGINPPDTEAWNRQM